MVGTKIIRASLTTDHLGVVCGAIHTPQNSYEKVIQSLSMFTAMNHQMFGTTMVLLIDTMKVAARES